MGKFYIPCKINGVDLKKVYDQIKVFPILEASNIKNFETIPCFNEVLDIEVGTEGTKECILRLVDDGFCVVEGTLPSRGGRYT